MHWVHWAKGGEVELKDICEYKDIKIVNNLKCKGECFSKEVKILL